MAERVGVSRWLDDTFKISVTLKGIDGALEIIGGAIIVSEVHEEKRIPWAQGSGFRHIRSGFGPFALATLNRSNGQINVGRVWQTFPGDGEFVQSALVIALAIIMVKAQRQVCLGQVRL